MVEYYNGKDVPVQKQTPVPVYKQITDSSDGTIQYIGLANPGVNTSDAKWQIRRQTVSGSVVTIEFANGSLAFNQIWDKRTFLSYS